MTRQELLNASLQPSLLDAGWNDEMRGRKMDASAATPESYTSQSSSVEWLSSHLLLLPSSPSPPTLHPSASALHLGLGAMTGPSIISTQLIAADCNCRELFRLCWNCPLNWKEAERERYCGSNKLHVTHVKHRPCIENNSCGSLTVPINEAEQGNLVLCYQLNTESLLSLSSDTLSKDWGDVAWSSRPPGWRERSWLLSWLGWCGHSRGAEWNWLPPSLLPSLPPPLPLLLL